MQKLASILFFILTSFILHAQSNEATLTIKDKKVLFDTSRIESRYNDLGIYFFSIRKFRNIELRSIEYDQRMKFEPNGQTNLGFGFNYKWMGIGIAFSLPFMNKDNDIYGNTVRHDLQVNLFSRFYGISAYVQHYKGFHLSNPNEFLSERISTYPYFEDLQSASVGLEAFYFFNNKKFSFKAAFIRNEIQKKSAGGFVLGAFYKFSAVSAPSGFVPPELPDSLHQIFNFNGYKTSAFGISFGYAYTLVLFKRAFVSLSAVPGIGTRNLTINKINNGEHTHRDGTGNFTARMSFGYEGKRLYWGLASIIAVESFKYEEVDVSASTGYVRLYIGKRFSLNSNKKK